MKRLRQAERCGVSRAGPGYQRAQQLACMQGFSSGKKYERSILLHLTQDTPPLPLFFDLVSRVQELPGLDVRGNACDGKGELHTPSRKFGS